MSIALNPPIPHPFQPGVSLNKLAVDGLTLRDGAGIDAAPKLTITLRPFAEVTVGQTAAYLSASGIGLVSFSIPDVYAWVAERAAAGDTKPAQAMALLVQVAGEEYERQKAAQ